MDDRYNHPVFVGTWKYNKRRNVNSDFSILAMHRVFVFFELSQDPSRLSLRLGGEET